MSPNWDHDDDSRATCPHCGTSYDRGDWGPDPHLMFCKEKPPERAVGPCEAELNALFQTEGDEFLDWMWNILREDRPYADREARARRILNRWRSR